MNAYKIKHLCGLAALLVCLFSACTKPPAPTIAPSEFTKAQQEELGELLQNAIALNDEYFQILPNSPPYDTSVYWLVQKLYDQATNVMRVDHQAPSDNHWTRDKRWPVQILVSEEKNAFVLPGGYFYITTGLLKTLQEEYELYYILTFEATLMNEGLLLKRLVSEVNTNTLTDLVNNNASPGGTASKSLAQTLSTLEFAPEEVQKNDELTVNAICNTSLWDRTGVYRILDTFDDDLDWLFYRPSYTNRKGFLQNLHLEYPEDCGSHKTNNAFNEGYKRYVLDRLN